jgi:hypothetical protein
MREWKRSFEEVSARSFAGLQHAHRQGDERLDRARGGTAGTAASGARHRGFGGPFVGLFGTVWGIMRSFTAIASEQNTSLAVVAPGIAEALFATAIGLFAAIPAVIAYNRFSHGINKVEAHLNRFADGFHATLSRQLDSGPTPGKL